MYWFDLRPNGSPYNRPTHTLFKKKYICVLFWHMCHYHGKRIAYSLDGELVCHDTMAIFWSASESQRCLSCRPQPEYDDSHSAVHRNLNNRDGKNSPVHCNLYHV